MNYNFTASIAIPDLNGYDLLDAREKLDFEKSIGMYKDNNADAQINKDKDYNYKLSLVESGVNTYWLSQPLKVEFNQKHSIFIEGGDKAVRYGIDFKYDKDNGVMKGSARDRGALGFSLSYNLKDKLLVRNYLTVNKVKSKESPYGDFSQYALLNPYYPFQDEHGNLIRKMTQYINTNKQIWNPVYEATVGNRDESEYLDVTNNFSLEWSIVQGLRLRANFSYGEKKEQVETFISPESLQYESYELSSGEGLLNKGEGYHGTSNTYSMDFNSVLTYYLGVGKHFINTALGEPWEERGEAADDNVLLSRRERYNADLPDGVLLVTAGVDVQDDRLEIEITGWGKGYESWGILYKKMKGSPELDETWDKLEQFLDTELYFANGNSLLIAATCIDTGGHFTTEVYKFLKRMERKEKRIFGTHGMGREGIPLINKTSTNNVEKVKIFMLGVDSGKEILMTRLKTVDEGPGYCHFPINADRGYDETYIKGLTSEQRVVHVKDGRASLKWVKKSGTRNEPLDLRNYATAAAEILRPDWDVLEKKVRQGINYMKKQPKERQKRKKSVMNTGVQV